MRIIKIEQKKQTVLITLDNEQKYEFVKDVQGEFYLYLNKDLASEELTKIVTYSAMIKHYQYVLRLLSKAMYAEDDIKTKLIKRGVNAEIINLIIKRLKDNNLLDDENYAASLFQHYFKAGYGPLMIRRKLESKNIKEEVIARLVDIDEETQINHALLLATNFAKRQKNIAKSALLNKIYSKLTRDGYNHNIIHQVSEILSASLIDNDEQTLITDYPKTYARLARKIEDQKLLEAEVIKKLIQKGYRYGAIRKYIEDNKNVY